MSSPVPIPEGLKRFHNQMVGATAAGFKTLGISISQGHSLIERIATLEATVREQQETIQRLEWKQITPLSLPKEGDEVGGWSYIPGNPVVFDIENVEDHMMSGDDFVPVEAMTKEDWDELQWTHYRPINPPQKGPTDAKHEG
jgi:hypothetical protein